MLQTLTVTVVALGALAMIVRRFSSTWLPAAFRPARRQAACDSCPLAAKDAGTSLPRTRG